MHRVTNLFYAQLNSILQRLLYLNYHKIKTKVGFTTKKFYSSPKILHKPRLKQLWSHSPLWDGRGLQKKAGVGLNIVFNKFVNPGFSATIRTLDWGPNLLLNDSIMSPQMMVSSLKYFLTLQWKYLEYDDFHEIGLDDMWYFFVHHE